MYQIVPDPVAELLTKLVIGGLSPNYIGEQTISELKWGSIDLSKFAKKLTPNGKKLTAYFQAEFEKTDNEEVKSEIHSLKALLQSSEQSGQRLEGRLSNGNSFVAEQCFAVSINSTGEQNNYTLRFSLRCENWQIYKAKNYRIWAGKINSQKDLRFGIGNLAIHTDGLGVHQGGYCLKGHYVYYLIRLNQNDWFFLFDTGSGNLPDRQMVFEDFIILQFAYGCRMSIDNLCGLDNGGESVAWAQGDYGKHIIGEESNTCHTIGLGESSKNWLAAFFQLASKTYAEKPNYALYIPCVFFLDALNDHTDGAYLRLQVALEGFALRLLNSDAEIVKDKEEWKKWVKKNRNDIISHARDNFAESLFGKVMQVYRLASGRVVPNVFNEFGLTLTSEMQIELERRDVAVHTASIAGVKNVDHPIKDVISSLDLVRTMLVALVAKAVGFSGPIMGWERNLDGSYKLAGAEWWPIPQGAHEPEASTEYLAGLREIQIRGKSIYYRWTANLPDSLSSLVAVIDDNQYIMAIDNGESQIFEPGVCEHHRELIGALIEGQRAIGSPTHA